MKQKESLVEEALGQFDDERILRGLVSPQEVADLERRLVPMYLERAKLQGRSVFVLTDHEEYDRLKASGLVFEGKNFYLLTDENCEQVLDMAPVVYRLLDTREGLFYAKLMRL